MCTPSSAELVNVIIIIISHGFPLNQHMYNVSQPLFQPNLYLPLSNGLVYPLTYIKYITRYLQEMYKHPELAIDYLQMIAVLHN